MKWRRGRARRFRPSLGFGVSPGITLLLVAASAVAGVGGWKLARLDREAARLLEANPSTTAYMLHRGDQLGSKDAPRVDWVPLPGIAPVLVCAVIKAEDRTFFRHHGFDWEATRRAVQRAFAGKKRTGASTITQQLARNLFLAPERSLSRKLREALIAGMLERRLPKERIIELYLNVAEWGDGTWGIKAASAAYFGKPPARLDLFEAVVLASLLPAPRRALTGLNRERAERAQLRILRQLRRSGLIGVPEARLVAWEIRMLHRHLSAGVPMKDALAVMKRTSRYTHELRYRSPPLPLEHAVRSQCGLEQELSVTRRGGRSQSRQ